MKRIILCGVFDSKHDDEIINKSKKNVEFSANMFQIKLINGFKENKKDIQIVSAPFIGAFPIRSRIKFFEQFETKDDLVDRYVSFNNFWGFRNISRKNNCFKKLNSIIDNNEETIIYVYSAHTPFLQAAVKTKNKNKNIKICLIVPDLPEYMNLEEKKPFIYKFAKNFDKRIFYKLCKKVDSFVLLTKEMKEPLNVANRPFLVVEGILDEKCKRVSKKKSDIKKILYAGKLDRKFGILNLLKAFTLIDNSNIELIICGAGEDSAIVDDYAKKNPRIKYYGQVNPSEAKRLMNLCDVLVNPRQNNGEYTKYSFPSKMIDYLSTGNVVVAYKLDGVPDEYNDIVMFVPNDSVETLAETLNEALNLTEVEKEEKRAKAFEYLNTKLLSKSIVAAISTMNGDL